MRSSTLGRSLRTGVKAVQIAFFLFVAIYAFAGWSWGDSWINLKTVAVVMLTGALVSRLAAMIPDARYKSRPDRLILASL